jgi:hypothetical protein
MAAAVSTQDQKSDNLKDDELVENEPYLGPAWAVAMFILYLLKEAFPAEQYTLLWWFQTYVIVLVIAITMFTLVKRHQFYRESEQKQQLSKNDSNQD